MDQWFIHTKKADFNRIAAEFHIDPVTARILRNRDMISDEEIDKYLNGTLSDLYDAGGMKNMASAVEILEKSIETHLKIRVIGDYDIDGVSSTYILVRGLTNLGADVSYAIPHRIRDGYGLNETLVEEAFKDGAGLILTCDNGISAIEQIAYAKSLGIQVIVTDHHEIPYEENESGAKIYRIPAADAVVDPKQNDCPYPFKEICGCVVAYKLMITLYRKMGKEAKLPLDFLEIAAFATIGDVMELTDENRLLVKYGLKQMKHTTNLGLQSLIEVTNLSGKEISPYHVGFVLGPCMNATGRLDSATRALQLLLSTTKSEAANIASELKAMNDSRKDLTAKGTTEAIRILEESGYRTDKVLVIFLPQCHESLAGIIAGRLKEKYYRPSIVLTDCEDGVKGSARSIETYSMYDELNRCKDLLTKFGGHRMAAGLSLPKDKIDKLRKRLNENCTLTDQDFIHKIYIDMALPPGYITEKLLMEWRKLEPFGNGNAKPVFGMKNVKFLSLKLIGKQKNVAKCTVLDEENRRFTVMNFGDQAVLIEYIKEKYGEEQLQRLMDEKPNKVVLSLLYYPEMNEFGGNKQIQLIMQSYQ